MVQTVAVDSAGKFTISGLPTPSNYVLTATKPGFVSRPRTIAVEPGDSLHDIVLDLLKGDGLITGTVDRQLRQLPSPGLPCWPVTAPTGRAR